MQILLVLLSLALLIFLCFKGVPIFFSAVISGLFLLLTAGMNPVEQFTTTYVQGLSGYFGKFFFIFVLGSLFGKLTDISGAADAIAKAIVDKLGDKFIIPSIIIAGAVLTYGGVSVFVCMFTLYPLMVSMFKRGDISRTLIPAVYFAGAGTFSCMMPGSPQIQNLMPGQILGTPATAALAPGLIAAVFEAVLVFWFTLWYADRCKKKGMHFEITEKDKLMLGVKEGKQLPSFLVAILPMIVLLVALNVFRVSAEVALFLGFMSGLVFYFKYLPWKDIWQHLADGTKDGTGSLFSTSAVVGFGSLVQVVPAFDILIKSVTGIGGSPLIASALAVTLLAGVCGSGSGGLGIALPIIKDYFIPMGINLEALHRVSALASLGLDSLPHNGLVVTVLNITENDHKSSYFPVFISTCVIPLITLAFLIMLFYMFGMA
ncbi:GntP family permease [Lacrimispora brassicae]